jgi:hypothetical protein
VVRVEVSAKYLVTQVPESAADDFWQRVQDGLVDIAAQHVDWLEGPHELDNIPDWTHDAEAAHWYAAFWSRLADQMHSVPFNPLVGSIPSGAPALDGELNAGSKNLFKPIAEVMKSKSYRWGWSASAYSQELSQSASTEAGTSLRYRAIHDQCGLGTVPLVLSEAGQGPVGWKAREPPTTGAAYLAWLEWFDGQLQADAYLQGAALFELGAEGRYASYDLAPLAKDLGSWIRAASFPDAGVGDAGLATADAGSAGGGSGGLPAQSSGDYALPERGCGCSGSGAASLPLAALLLALAVRGRRC